jgi:hypothetical protein
MLLVMMCYHQLDCHLECCPLAWNLNNTTGEKVGVLLPSGVKVPNPCQPSERASMNSSVL